MSIKKGTLASREDTDQMLHKVTSNQGLYCLNLKTALFFSELRRKPLINDEFIIMKTLFYEGNAVSTKLISLVALKYLQISTIVQVLKKPNV